jgi:hypothetical protein
MKLRTLFWTMTVACVAAFSYTLTLELVGPEFDWLPSARDRSVKYAFSGVVAFCVAVFVGITPAVYRAGREHIAKFAAGERGRV